MTFALRILDISAVEKKSLHKDGTLELKCFKNGDFEDSSKPFVLILI